MNYEVAIFRGTPGKVTRAIYDTTTSILKKSLRDIFTQQTLCPFTGFKSRDALISRTSERSQRVLNYLHFQESSPTRETKRMTTTTVHSSLLSIATVQ
jgi:hypothetical protein